jgi:hypothetical protein
MIAGLRKGKSRPQKRKSVKGASQEGASRTLYSWPRLQRLDYLTPDIY